MPASERRDTSPAAAALHRALVSGLSPSERMGRALALSALAREFAWAGARRAAETSGPDAVRQRFLELLYGPETAAWVAARLGAVHAG